MGFFGGHRVRCCGQKTKGIFLLIFLNFSAAAAALVLIFILIIRIKTAEYEDV